MSTRYQNPNRFNKPICLCIYISYLRQFKHWWRIILLIVTMLLFRYSPLICSASSLGPFSHATTFGHSIIYVSDYLPKNYVRDGSVSYQCEIQNAIDDAAREGRTLVFPPMVYQIDESGLQVGSHLTLSMYGAVFKLDQDCNHDGQVFFGQDVVDIQFCGGKIVGQNDVWPDGVNIRGLSLTGQSRNIRIRDMHIHDLSSNGIGIFGDRENPACDIWITDVVIENCCNYYGDYLSERPGPERDSDRKDQGLIAFYYVQNFFVGGCRFEKSRSDGTHFYKCKQGQFVHNKVYSAQMGGYFVETCEDVVASNNIVRNNGSRGVTIERGSQRCTLKNCVVANSGREGLWAPDCVGLVVIGNVFNRNGRKPNGTKPHQIWNANITVNEATYDSTNSPTEDYIIANNIIYTTNSQIAAIRIDGDKSNKIIVRNNLLRGENIRIMVEGDNDKNIIVKDNE